MPLTPQGEIAYQPARPTAGIRLQANPPVCNRCWQTITRQNLACTSVVGAAHTVGRFEFIECTTCTTVRDDGSSVTCFWTRHQC
jgi:hypothetical protein